MSRIKSLIFDKTLPHFLPYNIMKKFLIKSLTKNSDIKNLLISFTFDVEQDFGKTGIESLKNFFLGVNNFIKNKKIKATFFVQGNLINSLSNQLYILQKKGMEIGLHGFTHDLWGNQKWWIKGISLNIYQKKIFIEKSINCFIKNNLKRPISFRAPHLIVNSDTLKLLKKFEFLIDSSSPSYEGVLPVPSKFENKLLLIPPTCNPIPKFHLRYFFPITYYDIFNFPTLKNFNHNKLLEFVNTVASFQKSLNVYPHFIFLAHPWEFIDWKNEKYNFCSAKNFTFLEDICKFLEKNYHIEYVRLNELPQYFRVFN